MSDSWMKASRTEWNTNVENSNLGTERLQVGCLQRIALACESMAKNHDELVAQRDYWKREYELRDAAASSRLRRISALRGQITKLKKQLAEGGKK